MVDANYSARADRGPLWPVRRWLARGRWWCGEHPRAAAWLGFAAAWGLAALAFYWRFPNNFTHPNFYAEDAYYAQNIVDHGFGRALFTTFNGYFIWGIYLLQGLGWLIAAVFWHGNMVEWPRGIAVASYGFLGLCAALPVMLLRRVMPLTVRLWLAAMVTFVPLPTMDYGIIGTLANAKFAFVYVAALLLVYRQWLPADSKQVLAVDLGLLVSAYTTVSVYVMMPFALVRYWRLFKGGWRLGLRQLTRDRSFWSLVVLGALLVYQVYVIKTQGIPELKGFYDQPYKASATIELAARTFLFGLIPALYTHLTNLRALVLVAGFVVGAVALAEKRWRWMAVFVMATIVAATVVFFSKRSGVSWLFDHYGTGGPDQFFFGQNWLAAVLAAGAIAGVAARRRGRWWRVAVMGAPFVLLVQLPYDGSFGANDFMANTRGTVFADAKLACAKPGAAKVTIPAYPQPPFTFSASRTDLCTPAGGADTGSTAVLGLKAEGAGVVNLPGDSFTQTFVAPHNHLRGVSLLLATYGKGVHNTYRFSLYDKSCTREIFATNLRRIEMSDNAYYPVTFPDQGLSEGQVYCFSVAAVTSRPATPVALRLTAPGAYPAGKAVLDGKPVDTDIVFELIDG